MKKKTVAIAVLALGCIVSVAFNISLATENKKLRETNGDIALAKKDSIIDSLITDNTKKTETIAKMTGAHSNHHHPYTDLDFSDEETNDGEHFIR